MELHGQGLTDQEIADQVGAHESTVRYHRRHLELEVNIKKRILKSEPDPVPEIIEELAMEVSESEAEVEAPWSPIPTPIRFCQQFARQDSPGLVNLVVCPTVTSNTVTTTT